MLLSRLTLISLALLLLFGNFWAPFLVAVILIANTAGKLFALLCTLSAAYVSVKSFYTNYTRHQCHLLNRDIVIKCLTLNYLPHECSVGHVCRPVQFISYHRQHVTNMLTIHFVAADSQVNILFSAFSKIGINQT